MDRLAAPARIACACSIGWRSPDVRRRTATASPPRRSAPHRAAARRREKSRRRRRRRPPGPRPAQRVGEDRPPLFAVEPAVARLGKLAPERPPLLDLTRGHLSLYVRLRAGVANGEAANQLFGEFGEVMVGGRVPAVVSVTGCQEQHREDGEHRLAPVLRSNRRGSAAVTGLKRVSLPIPRRPLPRPKRARHWMGAWSDLRVG